MDFILQLIFELIVDGSVSSLGDKKVPMPLRILAALFLIIVFGGIVALCIFIGIHEKKWIVLAIGILIAVAVIIAAVATVKKNSKNKL